MKITTRKAARDWIIDKVLPPAVPDWYDLEAVIDDCFEVDEEDGRFVRTADDEELRDAVRRRCTTIPVLVTDQIDVCDYLGVDWDHEVPVGDLDLEAVQAALDAAVEAYFGPRLAEVFLVGDVLIVQVPAHEVADEIVRVCADLNGRLPAGFDWDMHGEEWTADAEAALAAALAGNRAAAADLHARIAARIEADGGRAAEADLAAIADEVAVMGRGWRYVISVGDDEFREAVQRHCPPAAAGPGEGELWRGGRSA